MQVYNVQVRKVRVRKTFEARNFHLINICHNFISRLHRRTSGSGTFPGAKHPVGAKRAGGTGFYPEVTNNALFNMEAPSVRIGVKVPTEFP